MATPITRFEKWNYQAQYQIFSKLYTDTAKTEWIRGPAFIAFGKSLAIRSALLTGSVGELTISGFRLALTPYQSSEQRQRGWILLKRVPWEFAELTLGSLGVFITSMFLISFDPEYYILSGVEASKVIWLHAEKGTLDGKDYKYDSEGATSRTKKGQDKWKNQLENTLT